MDPELRALNEAIDTTLQHPVVAVSDPLLARLRREHKEPPRFVRTPLPDWNRASRGQGAGKGLGSGWFVVVAGGTGAGKTLVALNVVAEALRAGVNTLFFSLEMSWQQLMTRLRGIVSRSEITHLEPGDHYSPNEAEAADRAILLLPGKLLVNGDPIWRLGDIRALIEAFVITNDVRLVVVDYAQLVEPSGSERKLFEAVSEVSAQLRYVAQKTGAVTLTLSQLNRSATSCKDPPTVDGLFASSRLGFDADQVLILDHTRRDQNAAERTQNTFLKLTKNRHGPQIDIPIQISTASLRIRQIMPHEEGEWP